MKILHSADWHLCSPLQGRTPQQQPLLRRHLRLLPGKIAALCWQHDCDLMLLSGDLFDGPYDADTVQLLKNALHDAAVPVFITPGNHDFCSANSPWLNEQWPKNVHIFTKPTVEHVELPDLNCRVYGAGFNAMDCPSLLEGFRAEEGILSIGILHGDPTQSSSPYNPISQTQVAQSGLSYLALGHIHKSGSFRAGSTLCAWPGCPMGRGYDEDGEKGGLLVTIEDTVQASFIPLDTPRFYDLESTVDHLDSLLPPVGSDDFYRITLVGENEPLDLIALQETYRRFPNLVLRDKTSLPVDIWQALGEDSFEGTYFDLLHQALEGADPQTREQILLAAKLSRQILDGREVVLP